MQHLQLFIYRIKYDNDEKGPASSLRHASMSASGERPLANLLCFKQIWFHLNTPLISYFPSQMEKMFLYAASIICEM